MADSTANVKEIISMDPYSIKKSLVDLISNNLGTTDVDTLECGFLGYLIQSLTLLTSDTLSNLSFSWNEAFTNRAKLRTSVNDLANMFDYKIVNASPCQGTMTVQIEYPSSSTTTFSTIINNGSLCSSSSIPYLVDGTYYIQVGAICSVKKKNASTSVISDVPYTVIVKNSVKYISFSVNVHQIKIFKHEFTFTGVTDGQFCDVNISGFEDSIYDMQVGVYITKDNNNYTQFIKFTKIDNIYAANGNDKVYTFILGKDNTATIRFGNGTFGYQPQNDQQGLIVLYTTMGSSGGVVANSLSLKTNLVDSVSNQSLNVFSSNINAIKNGTDEEELETMKQHIIDGIASAKRLVSESDYQAYPAVTSINDTTMYPLLLRRDTNANEIDLFTVLFDDNGKPIPTTSLSVYTDTTSTIITASTVYRVYYNKGDNSETLQSLSVMPKAGLTDGKHYYIDDDYATPNTDWYNHQGQLATYNTSTDDQGVVTSNWTFADIDSSNKVSYVCPYNIRIEGNIYKRALYEYIPTQLSLAPTLQDQTSNAGVEMAVGSTLINVLPETALEYSDIEITHFVMIHTLDYSVTMDSSQIECETAIVSNENTPSINKTYTFRVTSNDIYDGQMQFSYNIPIEDIPYINWDNSVTADASTNPNILTITTTLKYKDIFYNTYQRKVILRNSTSNINVCETYLNTELGYVYNSNDTMTLEATSPKIENITFGISTILFNWTSWTKTVLDTVTETTSTVTVYGYEMIIYLYKLSTVDATRIQCSLNFAGSNYSPYTYGIGGNGTILVYRIRIPYSDDEIPTGSIPFTIYFNYRYVDTSIYSHFSTYIGNVIARQILSNTMWSTINLIRDPNTDTNRYKIYRIPVIEKTYYEANTEAIESNILYVFAEVDYNFNQYKMLTDSTNIKYATTYGLTSNLQYNTSTYDSETIDSSFIYGSWAWDLAPTITAKIVVDNNITRTVADIVSECKEVIFSFLTMKSTGFNHSIIRSDITRYIHDTIPEIVSCEITSPSKDIIYVYKEVNLPRVKDTLLSYVPEFMWIDKDKISVETITYPAWK